MNGKKEPMMDGRQFHVRVRGVMVLLAAVLVGFLWVLYDLQYVHGAEYLEQSRRKIAKTETVEASRGQILDRYGRVGCSTADLRAIDPSDLLRVRKGSFGCEALVKNRRAFARFHPELAVEPVSLEDIMVHLEKEDGGL